MPKGRPTPQTLASERYQKKAGYKTVSFKLKGNIAERFREACFAEGESQAKAITDLMERYIREHGE